MAAAPPDRSSATVDDTASFVSARNSPRGGRDAKRRSASRRSSPTAAGLGVAIMRSPGAARGTTPRGARCLRDRRCAGPSDRSGWPAGRGRRRGSWPRPASISANRRATVRPLLPARSGRLAWLLAPALASFIIGVSTTLLLRPFLPALLRVRSSHMRVPNVRVDPRRSGRCEPCSPTVASRPGWTEGRMVAATWPQTTSAVERCARADDVAVGARTPRRPAGTAAGRGGRASSPVCSTWPAARPRPSTSTRSRPQRRRERCALHPAHDSVFGSATSR